MRKRSVKALLDGKRLGFKMKKRKTQRRIKSNNMAAFGMQIEP